MMHSQAKAVAQSRFGFYEMAFLTAVFALLITAVPHKAAAFGGGIAS
jgi:hypothetical protein